MFGTVKRGSNQIVHRCIYNGIGLAAVGFGVEDLGQQHTGIAHNVAAWLQMQLHVRLAGQRQHRVGNRVQVCRSPIRLVGNAKATADAEHRHVCAVLAGQRDDTQRNIHRGHIRLGLVHHAAEVKVHALDAHAGEALALRNQSQRLANLDAKFGLGCTGGEVGVCVGIYAGV